MNRRRFLRFLGLAAAAAPIAAVAGVPVGKRPLLTVNRLPSFREGMSPSDVNNSARAVMADLAHWRSSATEVVALTPREPWIGPPGAFA